MSSAAETAPRRAPAAAAAGFVRAHPAARELGEAAGLAALSAALFFFHLGSYGLWEPDEARYAEIAREMLATGDFILPHLNYVAYLEKPPLFYWLTALSFRIFGDGAMAARLVPALFAIFGVAATYLFAVRVFDRRRALLGGAILATSPLYAVMAQVLTTDMLLSTLVTVALYAFFLHWREGGRWRWLFYSAMGLAVLAKGPVGAALPILAALAFLWWQGEFVSGIAKLRLLSGLLLAAAIASPWFVITAIREPDFVAFYFVGEHIRRFFEPHYSHGEPIYFYLPVLAVGMMPWTLMVAFFRRPAGVSPARAFCAVAAAVIFMFFSLANSKLIPYILPALPPLALLISDAVLSFAEGRERSAARTLALPAFPLAALGLGAFGVALGAAHFGSQYLELVHPALLAAGLIAASGAVVAAGAFLYGGPELGLGSMALVTAGVLIAGSYARLEAEPMRSYAELSRVVAAKAPDATLICYHRYVQALPFYARRRVILVGPRSELTFGAAHAADAHQYFFDSDADLIRLWNRPTPTVLVIDEPDLDRLGPSLGDFRVIASEYRKRAVVRAGGGFRGN